MKKLDCCDVVANHYWGEAEAWRKTKGALTLEDQPASNLKILAYVIGGRKPLQIGCAHRCSVANSVQVIMYFARAVFRIC
jgi:hypothetical protein